MKTLMISLLTLASVMIAPLSADERSDVYRELSTLKKDFRKRISKIRTAGNDAMKAEQMKSYQAIAAVGKGIEAHPDLAEQRKARDESKLAYEEARKGGDAELIKATQRTRSDAAGALARDGFEIKAIQDLQAASVAQRKKLEALQYQLVAESSDEGKALIEKMKTLEARYEELKK